jgi:hypothetical protein
MPNLIESIVEAIESDDANREKQSARLVALYENSTTEMKAAIDCAFVALCGWSVATLITNTNKEALELQYEEYFDACEKANRIPLAFHAWHLSITK